MVFFLILCFIAHFAADYTPLSTKRMLSAKTAFSSIKDWRNALWIGAHAGVHAGLMMLLSIAFVGWWCILFGALHFVFHFVIDCGKSLLSNFLIRKGFSAGEITKPLFWSIHGFDQLLHAITILVLCMSFAS